MGSWKQTYILPEIMYIAICDFTLWIYQVEPNCLYLQDFQILLIVILKQEYDTIEE